MDEGELGPDFESGLDGHVVEMFDTIRYERKWHCVLLRLWTAGKDARPFV